MLLVALAFARAPEVPVLRIPVVPPDGEEVVHYVTWVRPPRGASETEAWSSDYDLATCQNDHNGVSIRFDLNPNDWPYVLPEQMVCTQGKHRLVVQLSFREPAVHNWVAADGTLVVPYQPGQWLQWTYPFPGGAVASAQVEPVVRGVTCEAHPTGNLTIKVDGDADVGAAQCIVTTPNSEMSIVPIQLVAYTD